MSLREARECGWSRSFLLSMNGHPSPCPLPWREGERSDSAVPVLNLAATKALWSRSVWSARSLLPLLSNRIVFESESKLRALQTLREIDRRLATRRASVEKKDTLP